MTLSRHCAASAKPPLSYWWFLLYSALSTEKENTMDDRGAERAGAWLANLVVVAIVVFMVASIGKQMMY